MRKANSMDEKKKTTGNRNVGLHIISYKQTSKKILNMFCEIF